MRRTSYAWLLLSIILLNGCGNKSNQIQGNNLYAVTPELTADLLIPSPLPEEMKFEGTTKEKVLELLRATSPNRAYLIAKDDLETRGETGFNKYVTSNSWFTLDLYIHEATHMRNYEIGAEKNSDIKALYTIQDQFIKMKKTEVFKSEEIYNSIPEKLRNDDTDRYIKAYNGANINGIYGLMEEYCAYYHGNKVALENYAYYQTFATDKDFLWSYPWRYYSEFTYYILHYMLFAQKNHAEIYEQIMANKEFKQAFKYFYNEFTKVQNTAVKIKDAADYQYYPTQEVLDTIKAFETEINKTDYQAMLKLLISDPVTPSVNLIQNPSFENGTDQWSGLIGEFSIVKNKGYLGQNALKIGTERASVIQRIDVIKSGEKYALSAAGLLSNSSSNATTQVILHLYDASAKVIKTYSVTFTEADQYHQKKIRFTTSNEVRSAVVLLYNSGGVDFFVDELFLGIENQ